MFSVAPESEWDKLYAGVDRDRVGISRVLTGYLAPDTLARIDAIVRRQGERRSLSAIARGVRGRRLGATAGSRPRSPSRVMSATGPATSPSTSLPAPPTTIRGDDWYRFLADCKYTLGVEGGASLHDPDGAIQGAASTTRQSTRMRRSRR